MKMQKRMPKVKLLEIGSELNSCREALAAKGYQIGAPPPPPTAEEIEAHEKRMAAAVAKRERRSAKRAALGAL